MDMLIIPSGVDMETIKLVLMQFIYRFSEFNNIEYKKSIDFENRDVLLQKIKSVDMDSYLVLSDFIEGQLNLEFIKSNVKLKKESPSMWNIALLHAKDEAYNARLTLISYSRKRNIPMASALRKKNNKSQKEIDF